ncbi:MAG: type IV secretory system conjugative DNA transfer family protein, partial [Planctomycetes bacterium]|nr:type IV secretory system conjugative DNA transfer family protein [Planctomycetota bacterium]
DTDAETLADLLVGGREVSRNDPFWDHVSRAFLVGCIAHVATRAEGQRNLRGLRDLLFDDDTADQIAQLLDAGKVVSKLAEQEFQAFLHHEAQKVRPSVLSTTQVALRAVAGDRVQAAVAKTSFDLQAVLESREIDIFFVIPPEHLESHGALLRLWFGGLMNLLSRRWNKPDSDTLLILDEAAALGELQPLRRAITLLRGYGVRVVSLWQDLSQIQRLYPDWRTLVNNCAVVQTFGASNWNMACSLADLLGLDAHRVLDLPTDRALVTVAGEGCRELRLLNSLHDRTFSRRADDNPRFLRRPRCDRQVPAELVGAAITGERGDPLDHDDPAQAVARHRARRV